MLQLARRRPDFAALSALTLVCALVFWPLLSGQSYYWGDLQLYFQPMATFWRSEVAQGRVPLWNAGILGGTPFVGSPQMWILYPSALLFLVFPAVTALALTTWLHLWLSGALFYGWMRRGALQLAPVAALLGACVWMLCGFLVTKAQFPNMLQALAWTPAVLWAGESLAARPNARRAVVLGVVLALQLLAAHAQISLMSGYLLLIYLPFCRAKTRASVWKLMLGVAGALVLAGLLACGQLLPILENLTATQRQTMGLEEASRFAVVPSALITLVAPYSYGNPMIDRWEYPFGINFWESALYLGIVPLGLAVVALRRDRRAWFWLVWALLFLWLACGIHGALWPWAFKILPGLTRFHDAARWLVGFSLGGAILAALGAQWLWTRAPNGARWTTLALLLTLLDLGVFARGIYPFAPVAQVEKPPLALWGEDPWIEARQGRLWGPDFYAIWGAMQPPSEFRVEDAANRGHLWQSAPYNRHLMSLWLAESGYEPMFDRASGQRLADLGWSGEFTNSAPDLAERLGRSSVRIVQLLRPQPLQHGADWKLIYASPWQTPGGHLYYYRNQKFLPRARFLDDNKRWRAARIVRETGASIALEVPARARIVELADTMRPGWSATLDGVQSLTIQTTIEGWRRLKLPPATGDKARQIRFDYAPQSWKLGVWVSLCALGFGSALWMATRPRNSG